MEDILKQQYAYIQGSRHELLRYCALISANHFVQPIENFGHSSIRNLLVHVANSSLYWLGEFAMKKEIVYGKPDSLLRVEQIRPLFVEVDNLVNEFITTYPANDRVITGWVKWVKKDCSLTPLELLTHVFTHFFHHKGQILTMSRHLGYTPIDTDVIRF